MPAEQHVDDPIARHEFPHPIAVLYDRLRDPDDAPRLSAALTLTEGIARYLAWTLLADAAARRAPRAEIAKYARASGFGAWLNTIQHFVQTRSASEGRLYPELDGLLRTDWWAALDRLRNLRNEAAHGRADLHTEATALLKRYGGDVTAVVSGCAFLQAYPLGMLGGVRIGADGRASGRWRSCRGTTPRGAMADLPDVQGIPSDQLLLVDVARGVALTLSPFLVLLEDEFVWLDLPVSGSERRSPYLSPVPGRPLKGGTPTGLHDAGGAHPEGLPLDAWLDAPQHWPRYAALPAGDTLTRIVGTSRATIAGAPSRGRQASIDAAPPPPVAPSWQPPPPVIAPTSLTSLPPMVMVPASSALPRRAWPIALGGLLASAAVIAVGVYVVGRVRIPPALPSNASEPGPQVASLPLQSELGPLSTWGPLEARLREWHGAIRSPQVDAASLGAVYADLVRFRGSSSFGRDPQWISDYWRTFFAHNQGTLEVDWTRSQWRLEPLSATMPEHATCSQLPGATGSVVLARLAAVEIDPTRPIRVPEMPCPRLDGVYLVRMREVAGRGLVICHEGWSLQDGICAPGSCPEARACRGRGR